MGKSKKDEEIQIKASVSAVTIVLLLIGIVIYISAVLPEWKFGGNDIIMPMVENLGITLFSVGSVSLFLEISSIKSFIKNSILELFQGDFPLESLSLKRLEDFHTKAASLRTNSKMRTEELKKSIYVFEQKLLDCADEVFYEYHNQKCTIDIFKDRFHKKYELDYKLINKHKYDNKIEFSLMLFSDKKITEENVKELVDITKFEVNGISKQNEVKNYLSLEPIERGNSKKYDYKVNFNYDLGEEKTNKIKMTIEYDVPSDDLSQVYKISRSSKRLSHEIFINKNETKTDYQLNANAFTAFFVSGKSEDSYFRVEQSIPRHIKISFDDWVVPGAGYVVSLIKNC